MSFIPDILFTRNMYDDDGDLVSTGIYLHFGVTAVKVCPSLADFPAVMVKLQSIHDELSCNDYPFFDEEDTAELEEYLDADGSMKAEHLGHLLKISHAIYYLSPEVQKEIRRELQTALKNYRDNAEIVRTEHPQKARVEHTLKWK